MKMTAEQAHGFAAAWYGAWNAHDLDGIMALYAEGIEHSSPYIARYTGDPECRALKGKGTVREYFARAIEKNPTLRFNPMHVGVGVETVNLVYQRMSGDLAVEVFFFDDAGKVVRSISHYAERGE
ncbi:MAG: nuclear transport factor 2 family protein [Phycisphaeraceae bacterium]|nr:nuclear transport factor 2 family protein [Phycisphaeraceae bacterium]